MQVKTRVKAGGNPFNHNETLVRAKGQVQGLTVKTRVKAGGHGPQRQEEDRGGRGTAAGRLRCRDPLARRDNAGPRAVLVWLRFSAIPQVMGELPHRGWLEKRHLRTAVYADSATHQGHWRCVLGGRPAPGAPG
jgi:hypothetical protein